MNPKISIEWDKALRRAFAMSFRHYTHPDSFTDTAERFNSNMKTACEAVTNARSKAKDIARAA